MKIALAQMELDDCLESNYHKTIEMILEAGRKKVDVITFPEVHLSKFFPQYKNKDVKHLAITLDSAYIDGIKKACQKANVYSFCNVYLFNENKYYDATIVIDNKGVLLGFSKMVHILQAKQFYEEDYYTASEDGFICYDTLWGKIGVVICFDRHLPESFRECALQGAFLVVVPTANTKSEPSELFEWEMRISAMQNNIFIAMTNRVGLEDEMDFAGESIVVNPNGDILLKTDDSQQLAIIDIDVNEHHYWRQNRPYISRVRPEMYYQNIKGVK